MWSERGGLARVEVVWSGLAVESGVVWVKLWVSSELSTSVGPVIGAGRPLRRVRCFSTLSMGREAAVVGFTRGVSGARGAAASLEWASLEWVSSGV